MANGDDEPKAQLVVTQLDEAFWRLPAVVEKTGLSEARIAVLERAGAFPRRRRISDRAVAWLASEVVAWMRTRPVAEASDLQHKPPTRGRRQATA